MKISHFLYNAFLIEDGPIRIAIDPGQNLWLFALHSLIPEPLWAEVSHVLVTHGDPDHYWHADRVALKANAPLVMNTQMVRTGKSGTRILAPRQRGLAFTPFSGQAIALDVNRAVDIGGVCVRGIRTAHGPLEIDILGYRHRINPGPTERAGFGSMGYEIQIGDTTIVNLGDTLLMPEWADLKPDILLLPIGGLGNQTWTMDTADALAAVRLMTPRLVIPCHYNLPFFWKRRMAVADAEQFKTQVQALGVQCHLMPAGSTFEPAINHA